MRLERLFVLVVNSWAALAAAKLSVRHEASRVHAACEVSRASARIKSSAFFFSVLSHHGVYLDRQALLQIDLASWSLQAFSVLGLELANSVFSFGIVPWRLRGAIEEVFLP